jgi:hypothetical protein
MSLIDQCLSPRFWPSSKRFVKRTLLIFFLVSPVSLLARGDDLVEMSEDGLSAVADPIAMKHQTLADAVKKVTLRMAAEILTEARLESLKAGITAKILPDYEKYIPLIRRGEPITSAEGTRVHFNFKVAPQSLKALLVEEGFLQLSDRPITLLPLITVNDHTNGTSFIWWLPTSTSSLETEPLV